MDLVIPAVIIGGIAYELTRQSSGPVLGPGTPIAIAPNGGSTLSQIAAGNAVGYGSSQSSYLNDAGQSGFASRTADPDAQAKLDLLQSAAQQTYNNMSASAKQQAASVMNSTLGLNPPLQGNETWEQVARIAGGAAGVAGCSAIPGVGVAIAPLCGMAAAYLGVKLEDWMQGGLSDLKGWVGSNIIDPVQNVISGVGSSAEDAYNAIVNGASSVYDAISNGADDVENWVGNLF